MTYQSKLIHFLAVSALLAALIVTAAGPASAKSQLQSLDPDTQFYVPKPQHGARQQIGNLISTGNKEDAELIRTMIETPQAVWLTAGTPPGMLRELSMGMSGDFEVAIQEGATIVRVGTAIFGAR